MVYAYDKETKRVTILEAIGKSGSGDDKYSLQQLGIKEPKESDISAYANKARVSYYKLKGGALQGHTGWIGYYRPKGYEGQNKKL